MAYIYLARSANLPTGLYIFTLRNFFFFLTWDKLSQDLLDRFSRSFHPMKGTYLGDFFSIRTSFFDFIRDVAMATDFAKICKMTFIHMHAGILQRIRISQFRFRGDKGHNFCYILCNFGEDRSTNPKDHAGSFCTFWDETAKIDMSYQISKQVLDRTSSTFQHW